MAKLPTYEEMCKKVAEKALDEIYRGKTIREWIEILVKQKPWEDCISRQAVMDAADKVIERDTSGNNDVVNAMIAWSAYIKSLPPVTPQPKIGRWIDDKCSVCGKGIEDLIDSREWYENEMPNFCPFCGTPIRSEGEE